MPSYVTSVWTEMNPETRNYIQKKASKQQQRHQNKKKRKKNVIIQFM